MAGIEKLVIKELSKAYNLGKTDTESKIFDVLWELFQIGNKYRKDNKAKILKDLFSNYVGLIGVILDKNSFMEIKNHDDVIKQHLIRNSVFSKIKTLTLKYNRPQLPNERTIRANRPIPRRVSAFEGRNNPPQINLGPSKFVIFSDHHMTENKHRHNYFNKNKGLYKEVLLYYADQGYGLIENGDVEEYTVFEPTLRIANGYNNLIEKGGGPLGFDKDVGKINWDKLKEKRLINREKILTDILSDHQDLYDIIDSKFASKGPQYYTKITGNHDPYESPILTSLLPDNIANNLCDALRVNYKNSLNKIIDEPKYIITHGHQFDSSTLPQHAQAIGEVFSETLAVFIQGADRVWDAEKTKQWRDSSLQSSFRNILATAKPKGSFPFNAFNPGLAIIENAIENVVEWLMKNHEIAWEYFDNYPNRSTSVTNEVLTGDEYFKVRHLSETRLVSNLDLYYGRTDIQNYKHMPKVIIGHTHEPRMNAKKSPTRTDLASNYLNTGSAGRFENFIWGIELVNDQEKVISWTKEGNKNIRNHWEPNNLGKLIKKVYPL